jgi:iron(III) transport system substrate-binding protein
MKKKIFAVAAVAASVLGGPASAQDWAKQKAELIAAAEKEGALVVYSQPNLAARQFVQTEWAKAFPNISISLSVMPTPAFAARIRTERQTGNYLWDLGFTGYNAGYLLYPEGIIDPLAPELLDPEVNNPVAWGGWNRAFVDNAGKYVFSMSRFIKGVYYDAKHVPPDKVARDGIKLLLDPAYKGKLAWHDPSIPGSGDMYPFFLRRRLGDEGLRKVIVDQAVVYFPQQQQVVEAMVRGTAWFGMGPGVTGLLGQYKDAGVPIDIRAMGNTPELNDMSIGGSSLFVFERRPHPNAARLFVNWILSKDVQYGLAKAQQQNSRRTDVPSVATPDETAVPGAEYLENQRQEYQPLAQEAIRLQAELRKQQK